MRLKVQTGTEVKRSASSAATRFRGAALNPDGESGRRAAGAGAALRELLRMLACDSTAVRAPREALARLRPFVDGARLELRRRLRTGGTVDEHDRDTAQLMAGAVAGLCHVARFAVDGASGDIVPPLAAAAIGGRQRSQSSPAPALELLFVVPENAPARDWANGIVAFVVTGLSDLGFSANHACCTPAGAALLAEALPSLRAKVRERRFVWGCYGLFAELDEHLPERTTHFQPIKPTLGLE